MIDASKVDTLLDELDDIAVACGYNGLPITNGADHDHLRAAVQRWVQELQQPIDHRDTTITALCDRIERIFCICIDVDLPQPERIKQIQEWSAGFMRLPSAPKLTNELEAAPDAWMAEDGRVITRAAKETGMRVSAAASASKAFTIPLYRAAQPPSEALPAQADVLDWAVRSFGPIAQNVDERAARVAEEAIEIAQVEGVSLETVKRIADRIYSRPAGERWQEIGGTMIGMLSYAEIIGLSLAECTQREFQRVLSKPQDWWQKKHAEKVAAGTADLSPCSPQTKGADDRCQHGILWAYECSDCSLSPSPGEKGG